MTHPTLSFWNWSDPIVAGGSKAANIARGVTGIPWLEEAAFEAKGGFHGLSPG
jgi:hypothetical protein